MAAPSTSDRRVRMAGFLGILVSLLMIASDLLLLFTPRGDFNSANFAWMAAVPFPRMAGHVIGVFVLPFYLVGFWHISMGVKDARPKSAAAILGLMAHATIVGTFCHGSIAYSGLLVRNASFAEAAVSDALAAIVVEGRVLSWPAQAVLVAGMLGESVLLAVAILSGETRYPRWFALLNAVLLLLVITGIGIAFPAAGQLILPPAQNLAMLVVFVGSSFAQGRRRA